MCGAPASLATFLGYLPWLPSLPSPAVARNVLSSVQVSRLAEGQRRNLAPSSCTKPLERWWIVVWIVDVLCSFADTGQDLQGCPWRGQAGLSPLCWGLARKELVLLPSSLTEDLSLPPLLPILQFIYGIPFLSAGPASSPCRRFRRRTGGCGWRRWTAGSR